MYRGGLNSSHNYGLLTPGACLPNQKRGHFGELSFSCELVFVSALGQSRGLYNSSFIKIPVKNAHNMVYRRFNHHSGMWRQHFVLCRRKMFSKCHSGNKSMKLSSIEVQIPATMHDFLSDFRTEWDSCS